MAKMFIVVFLLASHPGLAGDWGSVCPNYRKIQLAGLVILGGLTLNAWAANETADSSPLLCTDQFIIASAWVGNVYGIIDLLAWTLDFVSGYIFYAKDDTEEVTLLKKQIKEAQQEHHQTHQDQIHIAIDICDKIITLVENSECKKNTPYCSKNDDKIIDCINVAREIFNKQIKDREEAGRIL